MEFLHFKCKHKQFKYTLQTYIQLVTTMHLSIEEKQAILSKFPSFKLCYEKVAHNKVDCTNSTIISIPKGPKCFIWFSLHNGNPCCILIERGCERDTIKDISFIPCSFNPIITGTILSGTIVNNDKRRLVVLDDIYFYKNRQISFMNPVDKMRILGDLFLERKIVNVVDFKTQFMMAPVNKADEADMTFYCVQYRKDAHSYINVLVRQNLKQPVSTNRKVFKIIAETQNDIYTLYDDKDVECGLACIPTYEVSKMMNALFRNIKENRSLDSLEESDDEEEFENISLDKFIPDKARVIKMECEYVPKFKKWQPIKPLVI
jgi:hypothetical protein